MTLTRQKNRRCPECGSGMCHSLSFFCVSAYIFFHQCTLLTSTVPSTATSTTKRILSGLSQYNASIPRAVILFQLDRIVARRNISYDIFNSNGAASSQRG